MQARTSTPTTVRAAQALRGSVRVSDLVRGGFAAGSLRAHGLPCAKTAAAASTLGGFAMPVISTMPTQKRSSELQGQWRNLNAHSVNGYEDRPNPGEVSV